MSSFEKKENTHIILKVEDIYQYLSQEQINTLENIIDTIQDGRQKDHKPAHNTYYICNTDEPYSHKVYDEIVKGVSVNM